MKHATHKSIFKRSALALVLGACLSQGAALAQSTSGDIVGTVNSAEAGSKAVVKSLSSGVTRETTVGADGRFRIPALPIGQYEVTIGGRTATVNVAAGQTTAANFAENAKNLDTIVVKGSRVKVISGIDTSSVESRQTFTASQLTDLPVPRDISSVARLTPGTNQGSGYFGNINSFGGASVAENSYYVNGLNITDSYDNLSFSEVPWQAIDQLDVQTGGYGAQYGFSTGGVTSINIKRGTNEWHGGISIDSSPDSLRAHLDDEYFRDGSIYRNLSNNKTNSTTYALWESGPLIQDKLFIFAIGQYTKNTGSSWGGRSTTSSTSASTYDSDASKPYKLVKLDWFLNDRNHLEFTGFDNSSRTTYDYYNAGFNGDDAYRSKYNGQLVSKSGGPTSILKWTSNLTDDLTMALQYGKMKTRSEQFVKTSDGVTDYTGDVTNPGSGCPYVYYTSGYTGPQNSCYVSSTLGVSNGYSQREDYRLDFDWTLGNHDLSFGYNYNDFTAKQGSSYSGGHYYYYYNDQYVYDYVYATGGTVEVKQNSWYIQDKWHITDNFLLSLGVRNDSFKNYNTTGDVFVKQDNIWQPRVGFSWDVNGDGSSRLYGNVGRYALPIAANVALRAASASIYSETLYSYSGVSSTGVPLNTVLEDGPYYLNGENGSTPDAKSVASKDLKPYTQDEAILGYQYTLNTENDFLNDWVLGAKATYRKVRTAIDDSCSVQALYDAATAADYDTSNFYYEGSTSWGVPDNMAGCWLYNPGSSSTITADVDGDGTAETLTMSASSLGPKARRTYKAFTLSAEKSTDLWYANVNYTWSQSKGNYEGLVKSNNGQDDTGTTADFDFSEIMNGAYGFLPNDHMHTLKAYGGYNFTPEWQLGVAVQVQSGAPISCYGGGYGTFDTYYNYYAQYHYCNGEVSNQGSQGRNPWTFTVSPNLVYRPAAVKGLTAQLSLLNLFNNTKPLQVYQSYERVTSSGTSYYDYYRLGQYYQTPRYVRLQLMYEW